jgi:isopenicillin-N epimerase
MTGTRRTLLKAGLMALPASWASLSSTLRRAEARGVVDGDDDVYWRTIRHQFPLDDGLIYMNAANVCPASRPVIDRHFELLRDFHANPSMQNREKYRDRRESLRAKLSLLLHVDPDEVAITRNTSEGNNLVVRGIDLKSGDEILISDHNHPSNNDAWKVRARRDGLLVKSVSVPAPPRSADDLLSSFERAITSRTRVIAVTQITSTTGLQFPIRSIAELARARGIYTHVDGVQAFGARLVDVGALGCDSFTASAHKWLTGPLEAGLLYVRRERAGELWPSIVSVGWSDDLKVARKFETFGQQDDPRLVAFEAAVDFMNLIGVTRVEARVQHLASKLKHGLAEVPRVRLLTDLDPRLSGGIVKFRVDGVATRSAHDRLWRDHRIAMALTPSGELEGLRLSPHIYNTVDEIDRVVGAVTNL